MTDPDPLGTVHIEKLVRQRPHGLQRVIPGVQLLIACSPRIILNPLHERVHGHTQRIELGSHVFTPHVGPGLGVHRKYLRQPEMSGQPEPDLMDLIPPQLKGASPEGGIERVKPRLVCGLSLDRDLGGTKSSELAGQVLELALAARREYFDLESGLVRIEPLIVEMKYPEKQQLGSVPSREICGQV